MSGHYSKQVTDYLAQYVVYVRRSGADVALEMSDRTTILSLQGPKSQEALGQALSRLAQEHQPLQLETPDHEKVLLSPIVLEGMPYMSFVDLRSPTSHDRNETAFLLRAGTTGEDGFELVAPPGFMPELLAAALLSDGQVVRPAGIYCLDMLRMEAGLPRVGTDLKSGKVTPIRASLAWTLDQSKMRSHLMFGWQRLFFQLAKGPKFLRVGLLLEGAGHTGCRLLSNPHRQPVGEITSTAWSPHLQRRVAMAYVRPEYARPYKHLLLTIPYNLPMQKMRRKAIKKWSRMGMLRPGYRRIAAACVVPLPFVPHNYPEPARQRKAAARMKTFNGVPDEASPSRSEPISFPQVLHRRGRDQGQHEPLTNSRSDSFEPT